MRRYFDLSSCNSLKKCFTALFVKQYCKYIRKAQSLHGPHARRLDLDDGGCAGADGHANDTALSHARGKFAGLKSGIPAAQPAHTIIFGHIQITRMSCISLRVRRYIKLFVE